MYPFNDQVVLAGEDADIGYYLFGRRVMGKTFCRTCGVHLTNRFNADILKKNLELTKMPEPTDDDEKKWQFSASKKHPVNLRALDGVDLGRLTLRRIKTASQPPLYVNP